MVPPQRNPKDGPVTNGPGSCLDSCTGSQHQQGADKPTGKIPIWTYLLVDPPNLLLSQVHFSGGTASQNAESPRLEAGFTPKAAKRRNRRTNLKSTSQKARGWVIYGMTNKEAGKAEAWGEWRKVIGKGCDNRGPAQV